MSQGLDSSLLYCYASLMALNAFVAFYHIQFRWNEATLHHIVKDSIVDAAFAVFFPALILLYSLFIFQDDLMAVKIRQQFFPPRVFERKARNYKSQTACLSYPECVQFAYLWAPDSDSLTDVTQTLTELAGGGKLQTVQLVNRKINGSLPEELQSCQSLRNLVLIHTGVGVFPSWASKSFSKLEYLHIEGDSTDVNLVELPSDLFSAMANLHTIHLSYHPNLPSLPSLAGPTALQSVYYGFLDSIKEFPSVGDLPDLQVVALESLPLLRSLPEIAQYESTLDMVFVQDIPACCSGFLSEGTCNTTFPSCCGPPQSKNASTTASNENSQDGSTNIIQDGSNNDSVENSEDGSSHDSLPPTCLVMPDDSALLPSNATLLVLSQFATNASNFCDAAQAACPNAVMAAMLKREDICKGVLYRECSSESQGVGICFNEDMGRVQCTYSQATIDMREAEIAAGCRCDKVEEKWLGCA
ncbi:structural constituent of cell wall [Phytophthora ramorum]